MDIPSLILFRQHSAAPNNSASEEIYLRGYKKSPLKRGAKRAGCVVF